MKKNHRILLTVFLTSFSLRLFAADSPPPIMGSWEGKWINPTKENGHMMTHPDICAEVIGIGNNKYRIRFLPHFFKRAHLFKELEATVADGKILFNEGGWKGEVAPGALTGEAFRDGKNPLKFSLTKSNFTSPTLGMKSPDGATVLFDGKNLDAWQMGKGGVAPNWPILEGAVLEVLPGNKKTGTGGSIQTKEQFEDVALHLEFRIPYLPELDSQNRGNSGVFLQAAYEVQVLDSFGMGGLWNECGALYHTAPPKVNACLPPGEWQTYDILFRAARFNKEGAVSEYPRITVRQNGILVQYNEELREGTKIVGSTQRSLTVPKSGPIELQDHSHPVQYRNIWTTPLPDSAQALAQPTK